ncbi:hypothetical protein D3C75_914330 [compost metagenome]
MLKVRFNCAEISLSNIEIIQSVHYILNCRAANLYAVYSCFNLLEQVTAWIKKRCCNYSFALALKNWNQCLFNTSCSE